MFIRIKTIGGKSYFQVVETFRDGYRVRHRSIVSLGRNRSPKEAIRAYEKEMAGWKREISDVGRARKTSRMAERRCSELEERIARKVKKIELLETLPSSLHVIRHRTRPRQANV